MNEKTDKKTGQEIEKKPDDGPVTIWKILNHPDNKAKLETSLSESLPLKKFLSVCSMAIQRNPKLLNCRPMSVYHAIRDAATYGLFPNSVTNEGHLVPYKQECQFIVGYKGLLKLAWESDVISGVEVQVVHEKDKFHYHYGLNPDLVHVPAVGDRGEFIGAYAVVRIKGGESIFHVLMKEDAEKHRDKFSKSKNGPWKEHFEAMCMKTALRMAMKYTPVTSKSQNLHKAIHEDERFEAGVYGGVVEHDPIVMPERESEGGDAGAGQAGEGEDAKGADDEDEITICKPCDGTGQEGGNGEKPCSECDGKGIL